MRRYAEPFEEVDEPEDRLCVDADMIAGGARAYALCICNSSGGDVRYESVLQGRRSVKMKSEVSPGGRRGCVVVILLFLVVSGADNVGQRLH